MKPNQFCILGLIYILRDIQSDHLNTVRDIHRKIDQIKTDQHNLFNCLLGCFTLKFQHTYNHVLYSVVEFLA